MAKKRDLPEYGQYRVKFELNKDHGLVTHEVELLSPAGEMDQPTWVHSIWRDLALAVRDHFLKTHHYTDIARQLGWRS